LEALSIVAFLVIERECNGVRGYDSGTLGPKDYSANSDGDNLGGDRMITGNIEILAPLPVGELSIVAFLVIERECNGELERAQGRNPGNAEARRIAQISKVTGNIEILAPLPGGDRTLRIFGFLDAGYAWGYEGD